MQLRTSAPRGPVTFVLTVILTAAASAAGEPTTIQPGHPDLDVSLFRPFEADYLQMGAKMTVRVQRSTGARPVYSVLMIMDGPEGIGIDHIGHFAGDLDFAYRKGTFGAWGSEYVHAVREGETVAISRMPLPAEAGSARFFRMTAKRPFFDGTFVHWILALLPLKTGYSARMSSWALLEDGAETYLTPLTRITGRETVTIADGSVLECWVAETKGERATYRNYLVRRPPYLVRQVVVPGKGDPVETLMARAVRVDD